MAFNKFESATFIDRHLSKNNEDLTQMLQTIACGSIQELIAQTIPERIRLKHKLRLPEPLSENEFIKHIQQISSENTLWRTYIGQGYYDTITPPVIQRNILENPGWYTAYTPYQAEIAQGRLEALINYQTMVMELTGMEIANASLLDEATAGAEAMTMFYGLRKANKQHSNVFVVSDTVFEHTTDVLMTRAEPLGIDLRVLPVSQIDVTDPSVFGIMLQYPDAQGGLYNYKPLIDAAKENQLMVAVATDLMALTLLTPPGELGADVAFGSSQRFGIPVGFGGPHAAFFATKDAYKRNIPGRIIGISLDSRGKKAYRMALQTREQHIRREKATSNICTAQVLLSVMASMYAVYHGPEGLRKIATKIYHATHTLKCTLEKIGFYPVHDLFFDTLRYDLGERLVRLREAAEKHQINFYYSGKFVQISLNETTTLDDIRDIVSVFSDISGNAAMPESISTPQYPAGLKRTTEYLKHAVFNSYHTEHEILRYIKKLENKDLSMVHSMISLGSCTMKLNATTEMLPVTWPAFAGLHPFVPKHQSLGYHKLFERLQDWLCEITGFAGISFQPNSGAQGEYAGLLVIRNYHKSRGEGHRNIALIPSSAHGTNPASAVMAGMKVVVVPCDEKGNVDVADLKAKAQAHAQELACLMITYPSTHGVFEESIVEICDIIHHVGGQVYMDGANMNAQVGLTSPAAIGADVCHLNLHKTFCIPHGGGGPGMGPIGVAPHLVPFLPGHLHMGTRGAVSAAPYASASILPISYAYIAMMGAEGLEEATAYAILNANYIKTRLSPYYPVLYTGKNGRCAHEMIIDCRAFKQSAGIEVEDIAKRLMDYGFHAPTVSFPVAGTLMIEPTESESKREIDRFCDAMIQIRREIEEIEKGIFPRDSNVLKNAPHTAEVLTSDDWGYPYSRAKAAYPLPFVYESKFWPSVSRIDGAYGDRNLICSCIPMESYVQ